MIGGSDPYLQALDDVATAMCRSLDDLRRSRMQARLAEIDAQFEASAEYMRSIGSTPLHFRAALDEINARFAELGERMRETAAEIRNLQRPA